MNNKSSFADLLEESLEKAKIQEGQVVNGKIVNIKDDKAVIDVGLKSEGRLFLSDIKTISGRESISVGDTVDVFIEKVEDRNGEPVLNLEKAKREAVWNKIGKHLESGEIIDGVITGRMKGGFSVDIDGTVAFLPGSQVDLRLIKDISPLLGIPQPFKVLKMDRARNNIVVSRRAVLESTRNETRAEVISNLTEGQVIDGTVKNITDYGVFVDIGGIDGLLHVTDMSWKRVASPADIVSVGDVVKVQIIKFNKDTGRISLGMKQLMKTPWENIEQRYIVEQKYKGTVTNITDYGAFVELEEGVEGMVYITEMGWVRKNVPPSKLLTVGQQVEVMVLEVNKQKHRISLGLKQCQENPWQKFAEENPVGSVITGEVKNTTEFGIFIGVTQDLDGMIHMSDVSWHGRPRDFERGQQISVVVLDVKPDKERISLGLKQLEKDPYAAATAKVKKGDIVNTSVKDIHPSGVDVILENGLKGFIKKIDLSSDRLQQRTDMLSPGDKLEAVVLGIERNGVVNLSVKELEKQQEAEALKKFGSTDCGASFGDILGEAIRNNEEK